MLRPLRRLRRVLLPLYAGAVLAFVARLGWAHDPTCPHHAGHMAPAGAATPESRGEPMGGMSHAAHMAHIAGAAQPTSVAAGHAEAEANHDASDSQCRCLDRSCFAGGAVAVLDAASDLGLDGGDWSFDPSARSMPTSVARPGAYSTHRLPYPHAPPRLDGLT